MKPPKSDQHRLHATNALTAAINLSICSSLCVAKIAMRSAPPGGVLL
jgi:hypothetical protein